MNNTVNHELKKISDWLIANKLSLNMGKTNALLFKHKSEKNKNLLDIKINNVQVQVKSHTKYLGVILDDKLTFKEHIDYMVSKLIKGKYIITKLRRCLPFEVLRNTYNAHI